MSQNFIINFMENLLLLHKYSKNLHINLKFNDFLIFLDNFFHFHKFFLFYMNKWLSVATDK